MIATVSESSTLEAFGWNWVSFAFQAITFVVVLSSLFLSIRATRSFSKNDGPKDPLWLLVIWFIPFFGALAALSAFRSKPKNQPVAG